MRIVKDEQQDLKKKTLIQMKLLRPTCINYNKFNQFFFNSPHVFVSWGKYCCFQYIEIFRSSNTEMKTKPRRMRLRRIGLFLHLNNPYGLLLVIFYTMK